MVLQLDVQQNHLNVYHHHQNIYPHFRQINLPHSRFPFHFLLNYYSAVVAVVVFVLVVYCRFLDAIVGLISCRHKQKRRYCCLMACNISNGASRPCHKINSLFHKRESVLSLALSNDEKSFSDTNSLHIMNVNNSSSARSDSKGGNDFLYDEANQHKGKNNNSSTKRHLPRKSNYKLAIGTNEGRLIVVTLNESLDWELTRQRNSFIVEYTVGYDRDPTIDHSIQYSINVMAEQNDSESNSDSMDNDSKNDDFDGDIDEDDEEEDEVDRINKRERKVDDEDDSLITADNFVRRVSTAAANLQKRLSVCDASFFFLLLCFVVLL